MSKSIVIKIFFIILIIFLISELNILRKTQTSSNAAAPQITPSLALQPIPAKKSLKSDYHIFQSFNNCGPASLSMTLSYFGINKSQEELGLALRPYQAPYGDNDDKSVTFDEIAKKAQEYNLIAYHRPNGSIDMLKKFIARDIPVITRTWLNIDEDIGHYRIIKGYDDTAKIIIQDDSFQGKNLEYSYDDFNLLWEKFNYEYLVLVPKNKKQSAEKIIGEDIDTKIAWKKAVTAAQEQLKKDPENIYTRFNLSIAHYNTDDYEKSVQEYEKIEYLLPWRTLWYQIEPIKAYYKLGNYDRVFSLTDSILNNENRAFSELYLLRGKIFQKQGNNELAKIEFENALFYNQNLKVSVD